jgi:hypothetical protein
MHRWIQSPSTELRTPEEQLEIEFDGHHHSKTNIEMGEIEMEMVELQVDMHQMFIDEFALKVGSAQTMVHALSDAGPHWMANAEKEL